MIRRAVISDCPSILTLIKELAVFEKAPNEVSVTLAEMQNAGFAENPVWWAFVHENEHKQIECSVRTNYSHWCGAVDVC